MIIADEIRELESLRRDGILTFDEFQAAKQRVLGGDVVPAAQHLLEEIKLHAALARLDSEWLREREAYIVATLEGNRYIPKRRTAQGAALIFAFVATVAVVASILQFRDILTFVVHLLGISLCLFIGEYFALAMYRKAIGYEVAEQNYLRRREHLVQELDRLEV